MDGNVIDEIYFNASEYTVLPNLKYRANISRSITKSHSKDNEGNEGN